MYAARPEEHVCTTVSVEAAMKAHLTDGVTSDNNTIQYMDHEDALMHAGETVEETEKKLVARLREAPGYYLPERLSCFGVHEEVGLYEPNDAPCDCSVSVHDPSAPACHSLIEQLDYMPYYVDYSPWSHYSSRSHCCPLITPLRSPLTPAYSPTSPAYSPTSPVYSPY